MEGLMGTEEEKEGGCFDWNPHCGLLSSEGKEQRVSKTRLGRKKERRS